MKAALVLAMAFAIGMPAWAAKAEVGQVPDVGHVTFNQTMMLGSTIVGPGTYDVRAETGPVNVEIVRRADQKVVATMPAEWIKLSSKAPNTEILSNGFHVRQIEFQGRTQAIRFAGNFAIG